MQLTEQIGSFYLGRKVARPEADAGGASAWKVQAQPVLYDAKDLTTHAVCIGMTGSGKTGLAITLLEEAAIDGVPIIAIDPKGDLTNMLLTFPELRGEDFLPWIDEAAALRKGRTPAEHAQFTAQLWRKGLADWDQEPARIQRFMDSVERRIYTPGSNAGEPIAVLRSFDAPPPAILDDEEALHDRIVGAVSGLLGLVGIQADPVRSREHILLSNILDRTWREGRSLDLAGLIHAVQSPPFDKVGVFDLESFFGADDRFELAMRLNNLLASPGFGVWAEGAPLDVGRLLTSETGRPKLSVISIAHLDDAERMFFVSTLFNEINAWTRSQSGTSSLRALVYMDEVFGYLPPVANPPSKKPLLTLLKQARAFGVGIVLSTQNPVDLDYKALSNIGTWWLGRLQTERDKARVLDGLEGITAGQAGLDRSQLDSLLSALDSRVFLMHNVHEDAPVLMHTRWALSYLGGPLTRDQIRRLSESYADREPQSVRAAATAASTQAPLKTVRLGSAPKSQTPPAISPDVAQRYLEARREPAEGERLHYRPSLAARATLHHARARLGLDEWSRVGLVRPLDEAPGAQPWDAAEEFEPDAWTWASEPIPGASFGDLAKAARDPKRYRTWEKMLRGELYRERPLRLHQCKALKLHSGPGESEAEFLARLRDRVREHRDLSLEKLRAKMAPKVARLEERIRTAERALDRERSQHRQKKTEAAVSVGTSILGALFGRKLASATNVRRASSAAKAGGRVSKERDDVARAQEKLETLEEQLVAMESDLRERLDEIRDEVHLDAFEVEEVLVPPRKTDIQIEDMVLLWRPYFVDAHGIAHEAW